jgi:alpha-beta hydrolase superfamily lysophospholipase
MRTSTFTLDTVDGAAVYAVRWLPDREVSVRAVVQLVHGMQDHVARHEPMGVALTAAGYAVYGNDLRGHGHTAASPDELGFLAEQHGWVKLLDDLSRLTATIRREQPDLPVFLLGHSMGSMLTQQYLFTFPTAIDGALLSATTGDPDPSIELFALIAHLERARLGPRGRSRLLNTLAFAGYNRAFKPTRTPYDWLSSDPEQVAAYAADPWCTFLPTTQFWIDLAAGMRAIASDQHRRAIPTDLPILIIAGEQDPFTRQTAGVRQLLDAYRHAGLTEVTYRPYPGRHELLFDTNRDHVITDMIAWLNDHTHPMKPP